MLWNGQCTNKCHNVHPPFILGEKCTRWVHCLTFEWQKISHELVAYIFILKWTVSVDYGTYWQLSIPQHPTLVNKLTYMECDTKINTTECTNIKVPMIFHGIMLYENTFKQNQIIFLFKQTTTKALYMNIVVFWSLKNLEFNFTCAQHVMIFFMRTSCSISKIL
jgi:hypothetical protein